MAIPRQRNLNLSIVGIAAMVLLSSCSSSSPQGAQCGTVSGFLNPDGVDNVYRAVVTHLNGKPVISRPNYILPEGSHAFTVAELISSPKLNVSAKYRGVKTITIEVTANTRYHLAAQFNTDKIYTSTDSDYWQPIVWQTEAHTCELLTPKK